MLAVIAALIAAAALVVIVAVIWVAHLIDRRDNLHSAHRKQRRAMTIIRERGQAEIVGDGAWRS